MRLPSGERGPRAETPLTGDSRRPCRQHEHMPWPCRAPMTQQGPRAPRPTAAVSGDPDGRAAKRGQAEARPSAPAHDHPLPNTATTPHPHSPSWPHKFIHFRPLNLSLPSRPWRSTSDARRERRGCAGGGASQGWGFIAVLCSEVLRGVRAFFDSVPALVCPLPTLVLVERELLCSHMPSKPSCFGATLAGAGVGQWLPTAGWGHVAMLSEECTSWSNLSPPVGYRQQKQTAWMIPGVSQCWQPEAAKQGSSASWGKHGLRLWVSLKASLGSTVWRGGVRVHCFTRHLGQSSGPWFSVSDWQGCAYCRLIFGNEFWEWWIKAAVLVAGIDSHNNSRIMELVLACI